jgi:pyridoxamine 5'-phosphate oxidase
MTNHPIDLLNLWLTEEKQQGAPNPQQAVLSTATQAAIPHARVVAIREITTQDLLFFTQTGTRKVKELRDNPYATMTFWFELYQREVIIEGNIEALSESENAHYWQDYPREAQIRFYSYAPTSSQPIPHKKILENKKQIIEQHYHDKPLPVSPFYCGFRLKPVRIVFYAYQTPQLSEVVEYQYNNGEWAQQLLSP